MTRGEKQQSRTGLLQRLSSAQAPTAAVKNRVTHVPRNTIVIDRGPLLILGASARAASQAAVRSGFRPYAIDLFADQDLRDCATAVRIARYPIEFLRAIAAAPQAPWMYTGSLENYPRLVARLAKLRPLVGNGPEVLEKVRNPSWLAQCLSQTPVHFPETVINHSSAPAGDWLVKPVRSGGGMGIKRATEVQPTRSKLYLQRVVLGELCSAAFSAIHGQVSWLGSAEQWIGPRWGAPQEFQFAGALAPLALTAQEQANLLSVAQLLARAAGLVGLFGLDFIRNEQGLWLLKVNLRYTASMELLERLSNRRFIAEHCGELPENPQLPAPDHHYQAKLIVYAQNAGSCGPTLHETFAALAEETVFTADLPVLGTHFARGNPICTLRAAGTSQAEVRERLLSAAGIVLQRAAGGGG